MTTDELRTALEGELAWRTEEILFFKNQLSNILRETDRDRYRKSLVLILYSHLEGYIKMALLSYIQFLNSLLLKRKEFNDNLIAASMDREFKAYDSNDEKCAIFRAELPEDKKLHKLYRRVHLLQNIQSFKDMNLYIQDDAIDTESNLWYIVLKKNLYKVGLPVDLFSDCATDIDALVNRRNSLAHGASRNGVQENEYIKWEEKTFSIMQEIIIQIYHCACNEIYLKQEA